MMARMSAFATQVRSRTEATITIVGHGTFFYHMTGRWMDNCDVIEWDLTRPDSASAAA